MIRSKLKTALRPLIWRLTNRHTDGEQNDIVILSAPRSGSTWLLEMISTQPGMKPIDEPLYKHRVNSLLPIRGRWVYPTLTPEEGCILATYLRAGDVLEHSAPHDFLSPSYHVFTNRRVLKIIRATPLISWFADELQFDTIYLVRHPIAQSLSCIRRGHENVLEQYTDDAKFMSTHLTAEMARFVREIIKTGTPLEQFVTEWCLHNLVPLKSESSPVRWHTVTYEELVLEPAGVTAFLAKVLGLSRRNRLLASIAIPSRTADSSSEQKRQRIAASDADFLISSWREEVTDAQERAAFEILDRFGIDAYRYGDLTPDGALLVSPVLRA